MSYCNVNDIGNNADIDVVMAAERIINNAAGWQMFYDGYTDRFPVGRAKDIAGQRVIPLGVWLNGTIDVTALNSQSQILTTQRVENVYGSSIKLNQDMTDASFNTAWYEINGGVGYAVQRPISEDTDLVAGDSILRDGNILTLDEDQKSIEDDVFLLSPPPLRYVAKTLGRRLVRNELTDEPNMNMEAPLYFGLKGIISSYASVADIAVGGAG